ncbi:hypothetical protein OY671_008701, partial [Metschnikowia pulcherrima]
GDRNAEPHRPFGVRNGVHQQHESGPCDPDPAIGCQEIRTLRQRGGSLALNSRTGHVSPDAVLAAAGAARAQHLATTDSGGAGAETVTAGTHEAAGSETPNPQTAPIGITSPPGGGRWRRNAPRTSVFALFGVVASALSGAFVSIFATVEAERIQRSQAARTSTVS